MYLKSLQLVGFKSFAEKTTLEFLPGVTAIVGPNGCGKSNIADALRWVLGEQSAKALRGSEMADVIFNGTDGRKPIGMSEVSLTFAEVDPKTLTLPGVNLDFTEVTITRRVFRDGTGEYLINKTPCRLRDIQGMFLDTGIGRSSYSLMAQGQIDQILSAHPEDRRMIFEEAAGINKYKHQKKEALRKLEYTEANLVRLTDIIKEVKRQIISLQRQAGKARRYKELFDQLKALDTRLSRHHYDQHQADLAGLEGKIAEALAQCQEFAAQTATQEQQISDLRRSLSQIEQTINGAVARDHELRNESDRHQQRIGSHTERIVEFEQIIENHHREIAGSEERIQVQEQDLTRLNEEFAQIDSRLAAEQQRMRAQQEELQRLETDLGDKTRATNECKAQLVDLESSLSRQRNEVAALDHKKSHDHLRVQRLSTERFNLEDQQKELGQRADSFQQELTGLRDTVAALGTQLQQQEHEAAAAGEMVRELTARHHAARTAASESAARLEVLRQFFAAPDGRSTLGHILEVTPPYGAAIEAALHHTVHAVLAEDLSAARQWLTGHRKNPVVACPELISPAPTATETGGPLLASTVVRAREERFAPLLQSLLHQVAIADDLDAALALRAAYPGWSVATCRGEFISAQGILSAVSTSHIAEIAALTDQIAQCEAQVAESAAALAEQEQRQTTLDQELVRLRRETHRREVALAGKEGELSSLNAESRDLESKIHTVVHELLAIEQQDTEEKQRRQEILASVRNQEATAQQLREQISSAQKFVDDLTARKQTVTEQFTEQRVMVGSIQNQRGSIEAQRAPIAGRIHDLRERRQTCQQEIASYTAKSEQLRLEIAESEQRIGELAAARDQFKQQLDGYQHQRAEVATGIEQAEQELRELRARATELQEQKSGFEVALAQKRMELQGLKDRVWQKYQINIEDIRSDAITITVADQGPAVSQQVPLDTDWDAVEAEVAEMQSRLDAMGPVNVEAIQEYDELEERFKFLTQQHEDLVKAKEQLLQVISKINATTKQLFNETFEKIRLNFQGMYTELFGGGKANLLLLDEADPLESGIEIVAKPPGKQLQSITLLSGGEKTLTATALLFAIYMVKPSPFCVLDELDAPLDESNINRFIRILQRFVNQSQFVIITHNKRTIGMADALYGITMEEHGVSKVVSVKFSPREETERKAQERAREAQEDRIDGAASVPTDFAAGRRERADLGEVPQDESISNELLADKELTVAPIKDSAPIQAPEPSLGKPAPEDLTAEVKAAVANALEAAESVEETVSQAAAPSRGKSTGGPSA